MRKRTMLLAASLVLTVGTTGLVGYGYNLHRGKVGEREAEVAKLVESFKSCPDRYRIIKECFSPQERMDMQMAAMKHKQNGEHCKAGILFARLGMKNEAREMAGKCGDSGNEAGKKAILREISIRDEAESRMGI